MVERVGDHHIVFGEKRRHGAGVGGESRLEDHHRLGLLEGRQALFQLHVDCHRPGDGSHRPGTDAEIANGLDGRFHEFWVSGQAQIVVGRQIDDRLAVKRRRGLLTTVKNA